MCQPGLAHERTEMVCEVLADDIFHLTLGNSHDACGQLHGDGCCHNAQGQGAELEQGQGVDA